MSSTLSDPFLFFAFWTGMAALALTLMLALQIVLLRVSLRRHQRREQRVVSKWRPVLNAALVDEHAGQLPALRASERLLFLKLWIHLHESVRGPASAALNDIGRRLQCEIIARELLKRGNRAQRLLALLALGHLRDRAAWAQLMEQAAGADPIASVKALWALVQIDADAAVREMMPLLIRRDDWPLAELAGILRDAPEACAPVLAAALPATDAAHLPRALQLAEALRVTLPPASLAALLSHAFEEVVMGALRLAATPELLPAVRALAAHADWRVRLQAAKALGRIGDRGDIDILRTLLHDAQWWVRYRSAQALLALPFMDAAAFGRLREGLGDRYAADMLNQVLAEKGRT